MSDKEKYGCFEPRQATFPRLLNAEEVAERLHISRSQAYTLFHTASVPVVRIGRKIFSPEDRLLAWLENQITD